MGGGAAAAAARRRAGAGGPTAQHAHGVGTAPDGRGAPVGPVRAGSPCDGTVSTAGTGVGEFPSLVLGSATRYHNFLNI